MGQTLSQTFFVQIEQVCRKYLSAVLKICQIMFVSDKRAPVPCISAFKFRCFTLFKIHTFQHNLYNYIIINV